jgi:hypothetical protein
MPNPMVIRRDEPPSNTVECKACGNWARAVWLDENGAVPLCDPCIDARTAAYQRRQAEESA